MVDNTNSVPTCGNRIVVERRHECGDIVVYQAVKVLSAFTQSYATKHRYSESTDCDFYNVSKLLKPTRIYKK